MSNLKKKRAQFITLLKILGVEKQVVNKKKEKENVFKMEIIDGGELFVVVFTSQTHHC